MNIWHKLRFPLLRCDATNTFAKGDAEATMCALIRANDKGLGAWLDCLVETLPKKQVEIVGRGCACSMLSFEIINVRYVYTQGPQQLYAALILCLVRGPKCPITTSVGGAQSSGSSQRSGGARKLWLPRPLPNLTHLRQALDAEPIRQRLGSKATYWQC